MRVLFRAAGLRRVGASLLLLLAAGCGAETATPTNVAPNTPVPATATVAAPTATTEVAPSPTTAPPTATTVAPTSTVGAQQPDLSALSWQQVGLAGNELGAVAMLPDSGNTALAVGGSGVWRSSPPYNAWQPVQPQLTFDDSAPLFDLAVGSADVVYVNNYATCVVSASSTGYRSSDGGLTWEPLGIDTLDIATAGAQVAYAPTCLGLLKTVDSGASWTDVPDGDLAGPDPVAIDASADGQTIVVLHVGGAGGGALVRSQDGGATWEVITPSQDEEFFGPLDVALVPGSGEGAGLYAANLGSLWFLPAAGGEWQSIGPASTSAEGDETQLSGIHVVGGETGPTIYVVLRTPGEADTASFAIHRSTGAGTDWQQVGQSLPAEIVVRGLALAPSLGGAETLLAATGDGVWALALPPTTP